MRIASLGLVLFLVLTATGCTPDVSEAEMDFYRHANRIDVGAKGQDVKAQLGEPSRVAAGGPECRSSGGQEEWVYDSFQTADARPPLHGASVVFCVDRHGRVTRKSLI